MKRCENQLQKRREFVDIAVNNPSKAARLLRESAEAIEKSHSSRKVLKALSGVVFVSERTLWSDLNR